MKNNMRGVNILLLVSTFLLPLPCFYLLDQQTINKEHSLENSYQNELLSKIPLISSLYNYYFTAEALDNSAYKIDDLSLYSLEVKTTLKQRIHQFEEELQKLYTADIFPFETLDRTAKTASLTFGTIYGDIEASGILTLSQVYDKHGDVFHSAEMLLDTKSSKITEITIHHPAITVRKDDAIKELLWTYILYLQLDGIEDWEYGNGTYESNQARLQVSYSIMEEEHNKSFKIGVYPRAMQQVLTQRIMILR